MWTAPFKKKGGGGGGPSQILGAARVKGEGGGYKLIWTASYLAKGGMKKGGAWSTWKHFFNLLIVGGFWLVWRGEPKGGRKGSSNVCLLPGGSKEGGGRRGGVVFLDHTSQLMSVGLEVESSERARDRKNKKGGKIDRFFRSRHAKPTQRGQT